MKVIVPPIKSQGIKTKLVPFIATCIPNDFSGKWIEPFMGTGVVAFNLAPHHALLCDTNPHLIHFYQAIQTGEITATIARNYLNHEGAILQDKGEQHYYAIRERFNEQGNPLDFLFLNRAGFNGMIRFNKKGEFNIPFCRKPQRFAQAYVTKIVNQIDSISKIIATKSFQFKCQSFEETILQAQEDDLIYCDPPYIDRYADYFNTWTEQDEYALHQLLSMQSVPFILSTWHHNDYRKNQYIDDLWSDFNIMTQQHFYHVGAKEQNRNPMTEALVSNLVKSEYSLHQPIKEQQLSLFA